jgi:hypothetical protein
MAQPIWNTPAGALGTYSANSALVYQLSASAVLPAISVTYTIIGGNLPPGLNMDFAGLITGIPSIVNGNATSTFVVRATDNLKNIRDRTFNLVISGNVAPKFTTSSGVIATILDSTWFSYQIEYSNQISTNPVDVRVVQGGLPPGIEINPYGLIQGYAAPPIINVNLVAVTTTATSTHANAIVCFSTTGFTVGRPVVFTGTVFGGVDPSTTYYIQSIVNSNSFTISTTAGGPVFLLDDASGFMTVTLPSITVGEPTTQTYSFTLKLDSPNGSSVQNYSITVSNQNAASSFGPAKPPNTRIPTIFNTRPETYNLASNEQEFGYYVLPPNSEGQTYAPTQLAYIGQVSNDNYFSFKILGHDFDGNPLTYIFADLPIWLSGDTVTGWLTGIPIIGNNSISEYNFSVSVSKTNNPAIQTPSFNFSLKVSNGILGNVVWITPSNLGEIYNGTISTSKVKALSDVPLNYRLAPGSNALPPNLSLFDNGEISGVVAFQPTDVLLDVGTTTDFTFTVEAYSSSFPMISSTQTFTLSVYQEYSQPTDTIYIKCVPSVSDRQLLASLLNNDSLIPNSYLYRPNDPYFGKASSIVYEHAYGIFASNFDEYVAAITKNHYWRNITLGEIKTAVAKDDNGNIIYEVVYSEVIDNLINPQGISVSEELYWPRPIPLNLGPCYDSVTDIFTSYEQAPDGQEFYTSLTPGVAQVVYPNSLPNMRNRVGQELGQTFNSKILPAWMTSQQSDGSTLGYTPAWVIAYCSPGTVNLNGTNVSYAQYIQYQIQNNWVNELGYVNTLNTINFKIDRITVDKSVTYDYENNLSPPAWTGLPSATPTPNPLDSKDFSVLFPQQTILPNKTQY